MANHESTPQDPEETPADSTDIEFDSIAKSAGMRISYFKQLRQSVRSKAHSVAETVTEHIDPILDENDDFAYFETYAEDSTYRILALRRKYLLLGRQTIVAINQERSVEPNEEFFPDGRILFTTDLLVGKSYNPLTTARYNIDYAKESRTWAKHDKPLIPGKTTMISRRNDELRVSGNLQKKDSFSLYGHSTNWTPQETKRLDSDNATLTYVMNALRHCNIDNLRDEYTGFSNS